MCGVCECSVTCKASRIIKIKVYLVCAFLSFPAPRSNCKCTLLQRKRKHEQNMSWTCFFVFVLVFNMRRTRANPARSYFPSQAVEAFKTRQGRSNYQQPTHSQLGVTKIKFWYEQIFGYICVKKWYMGGNLQTAQSLILMSPASSFKSGWAQWAPRIWHTDKSFSQTCEWHYGTMIIFWAKTKKGQMSYSVKTTHGH